MNSLSTRISAATKYVAGFVQLPVDYPTNGKSLEEYFLYSGLKELGVTDDDIGLEILDSDSLKEGDARAIFCDRFKLPIARFRKVWEILKDGNIHKPAEAKAESSTAGMKDLIAQITPVGSLSDEQLLEKYGPDCDRRVETELKVRSNQRPCIVFNRDSKEEIDLVLSKKLLQQARRHEVPGVYKNDGVTYKVWLVGEFPQSVYTRCPVTGSILMDGYSEKFGFEWKMPYEALQFIALLVKNGIRIDVITAKQLQDEYLNAVKQSSEVSSEDVIKAIGTLKKSGGSGTFSMGMVNEFALNALKALFPKVAVEYDDLKAINDLPNLNATLTSKDVSREKKSDPFGKRF